MPGLRPPITATRRTRFRANGALAAAFVAIGGTIVGTSARADCIDDAAAWHQVNAKVLRAIGWQESRLNPAAIGRNANGSTDLGAFQINSTHLPELARFGVTAQSLADGCVSAYVAAWHYRRQVDRLGNTWAAVGAYHSRTPALAEPYAMRIATILETWGVSLQSGPPGPTAAQ
jgi:soluble lytic murein transglycosylase-like protein